MVLMSELFNNEVRVELGFPNQKKNAVCASEIQGAVTNYLDAVLTCYPGLSRPMLEVHATATDAIQTVTCH
jgi:hypothetical protein